jgi:acetyltransferase-like isoleucine patch superfamily enzyme
MEKPFYVHPAALVETDEIGSDTRIWAFAHVQSGAKIGQGCNVGDHSFIEKGVTIGDNVTVKNGVSIWEGVTIEDNVFVGPNVAFTNDLRPRSKVYHSEVSSTIVMQGASIGANATIVAGVELGEYCMIGAGAVVTESVQAFSLVLGIPAKFHSWVSKKGNTLHFENGQATDADERFVLQDGIAKPSN